MVDPNIQIQKNVIHNQISTFLKSGNFLYTCQSGSQKDNFTDFRFFSFEWQFLKYFDKSIMAGIILTDFEKAFDNVLWKNYVIDFAIHTVDSFQVLFLQQIFSV